ncbi:type 1 glutamine amidotransferase domain-containing protein [Sediminibacterium salmoneum]|uniref:type 1 glutamine amidotransferase domain-containing protein n=1 Tax=Sediminibacterium salmoneum TaxID=426421 RepID=UPI0004AD69D5|nr:type 1 glutamine amidotransferase domain-containing protein [Sediminibacterium salmoneum]
MNFQIIVLQMFFSGFFLFSSFSPEKKKVLIIVSSYGKEEGVQRPGYEFEEFSKAYIIFKDNGLDIDVASPKGGNVEPDKFNTAKPYNKLVLEDTKAMSLLKNTKATVQLKPEDYDAVYIVGGKGAMFDLPFDPSLLELLSEVYKKQNSIVAAVCHGPAALVNVKLNDSTFLVAGKRMTGFSNEEEVNFGQKWKSEFPFLLEDKLKLRGVEYESSEPMLPQVTVDRRIVTGQNPFSTSLLAEEVVSLLGIQPVKRDIFPDERSIYLVKKALSGDTVWAKKELTTNAALFDTQIIGGYGIFKLMNAKGNADEIKEGLFLSGLVSGLTYNKVLLFEMAKGYKQLNNKAMARTLLQQIIQKDPGFERAILLMKDL